MRYTLSDKLIAYLALLSGLSISAVAIYYSVAGLMAIFAAAVIPIMIMGVVLEVGKLAATVWLKQNWLRAPYFLKTYLLLAILSLMLLTSMGIFGYLSKAHLDQAVPTGDVADKVALIDEKIKTQKDNIEAARKALTQMDAQVDQMLGRTDSEKGAERAVQIRRNQQKERANLQSDIAKSQAAIAKLNEERAPIAKELRKVEAEVGPIKYIAALIYGDQADQNLLERAVRWVIIVIVLVFDPLAVILLLASQYSFNWFRQQEELEIQDKITAEVESIPDQNLDIDDEKKFIWPFTTASPQLDQSSNVDALNNDKQNSPESTAEDEIHQITGIAQPEENTNLPVTNITDTTNDESDTKSKLDEWNEMLAEAEKAAEAEKEFEEEKIIEEVTRVEKEAMRLWKSENPGNTWKQQRRLLEKGIIEHLPWEEYMKPKPDYVDEAALEAKKWAEENPETEEAEKAREWADEKGVVSDNLEISWMEHDDKGNQIKKVKEGYQQNAEQNERTIWQRIQNSKHES